MVIYFPGRGRRASEAGDCPRSPNGIPVHAGGAGRAPTAVARANAATHPGSAEGGLCGTPGPSGSITVEVLDAGAIETWSGAVYLRHKDEQ